MLLSELDLTPKHYVTLDHDHLESSRVIHGNDSLDVVTPYKILRTRVLQEMDKSDWRIMAVTAAHEGAGKTITAINLAMTIAQSGRRNVFLLDFDLRKPGIASTLGIDYLKRGLGDYLSEDKELGDILWTVGIDNLVIVPGLGRFENSSELLTSKPMRELLSAMESEDGEPIVIVDLPPVLVTDDAMAISPMVDCLLFVVAEGETKRADVLHSIELLEDVDLAGVVLNKSRDTHPGY